MGAAVEHVHQRHREHARCVAAEIAPQRHSLLRRLRVRRRERGAEDRVGSQTRLVGRTVQLDQNPVQRALVGGVRARQRPRDLAVDVGDRSLYPLAPPARAAIAQLGRLELARRRAGGHRRVAVRSRAKPDLDLHRRVAAAV